MLPIATPGPGSAAPLEALFTAVSAVCVTGLIVVDTPVAWTPFGHTVILALIQVGGFGVMTFASMIGLALTRKLTLRSTLTTASETRGYALTGIRSVIVTIIKITLAVEGVTALLLAARLWTGYGYAPAQALWHGVFHAVSSFNNAGFALQSTSLMPFAGDPLILLPICLAIIVGGVGFPVLIALGRHAGAPRMWSMNTRLVVAGTITLILIGMVTIAAIEWNNPQTLGPFPGPEKLLAAFTESVQTRTAGFNSLDTSAMNPASWLAMDVLMFIGGGPAGTAGGIKITTFGVLLFIMLTEIRGDAAVNVFGKRLSRSVHREATTVALSAVALVTASTGALMILSGLPMDRVLFETISAFGTVGMSTGITADLPPAGQLILIALMFIGRLGPITFATALALRRRTLRYELPKERPIIG